MKEPATLTSLPTELLYLILHYSTNVPDDLHHRYWIEKKTWLIGISSTSHRLAIDHPFANTNFLLRKTLDTYFLMTTTFDFVSGWFGSNTEDVNGTSRYPIRTAANDLLDWLEALTPQQRMLVRKLRLTMHATELLYLFAPLEPCQKLGFSREREAWGRLLGALKRLSLSQLEVVVLRRCCPKPCKAGEHTSVGLSHTPRNADGSVPNHFSADLRWVIKSVACSMAAFVPENGLSFALSYPCDHDTQTRRISMTQARQIAACSWSMLESSTFGYHECDVLIYDGTRATSWAEDLEGKGKRYRVPIEIDRVRSAGHADIWDAEPAEDSVVLGYVFGAQ